MKTLGKCASMAKELLSEMTCWSDFEPCWHIVMASRTGCVKQSQDLFLKIVEYLDLYKAV